MLIKSLCWHCVPIKHTKIWISHNFQVVQNFILLIFPQPFKNVKIILSSQAIQRQVAGQICPEGSSFTILALYWRGFRFNRTQLVGLLENYVSIQFSKHLLSAYALLSIILGPGDKVMNKTNTLLLSRNLKIISLVFTFTVLCCLLYNMMLFNYRYVVDVLWLEGITIHTDHWLPW